MNKMEKLNQEIIDMGFDTNVDSDIHIWNYILKESKKKVIAELFNYDDSEIKKGEQLILNAHRLRKKYLEDE